MSEQEQVVSVLRDARTLISDPEHWGKGAFERTLPGGGRCFCLVGAVREAGQIAPIEVFGPAFDALRDAAGVDDIYEFNDHCGTTHEHVLAVLDSAIASAALAPRPSAHAEHGGMSKHVPIAEVRKLMGCEWMGRREDVSDAIPPAYTEYIGAQLLDALGAAA